MQNTAMSLETLLLPTLFGFRFATFAAVSLYKDIVRTPGQIPISRYLATEMTAAHACRNVPTLMRRMAKGKLVNEQFELSVHRGERDAISRTQNSRAVESVDSFVASVI